MLSIWHYVWDYHTLRLCLDNPNLVLSIGLILNCFLYNIFLGQHKPNITSEIGEIWSFQYTVTQQDWKNHKFFERCFQWIRYLSKLKCYHEIGKISNVTKRWLGSPSVLGPLEHVIIMISEPRTLRVISKNLSEQVKHFPKRIIKDDQKTINAVLFISSLLSFESKSLQLLL